jgi:hypothetical protein
MYILNVELGISPVTDVGLILAFLTGVFAVTQRAEEYQIRALGYGVIIVSALVLYFDLVSTFISEDAWTVLGLLLIAAGLFLLRDVADSTGQLVSGEIATYAFTAVAVIAVLVLAVDVVTGGLAYELRPASEIQYSTDDAREDEVRLGTLVARNPTPLPEGVSAPRYRACAAGNWSQYQLSPEHDENPPPVRAHLSVQDSYDEFVFGYGEQRYPVVLHLRGVRSSDHSFPVEQRSRCPDDAAGAPYLVVYKDSEDPDGITPHPDGAV